MKKLLVLCCLLSPCALLNAEDANSEMVSSTLFWGENKVVTFVPRPMLDDKDIDSLFAGLVKLVKENAAKQARAGFEELGKFKEGLKRANEEILSLRSKLRQQKEENEYLLNKLNDNFEKMKWVVRV